MTATYCFVSSKSPRLAHGARAPVVRREREPHVTAEVVELPAEQPHARTDVAVVRPRRHLAEEDLVDELPALRAAA